MIITVKEGKGLIDILHDGVVSCLKINEPVAISYPEYGPTTDFFFRAAGLNPFVASEIDELLINGDDDAILESMPEFLRLFRSGEYQVDIVYPKVVNKSREYVTLAYTCFYDRGDSWLYVQPEETLNKERILYYEQLIKNGGRPKVILFCSRYEHCYNDYNYIIDGHHKTTAYRNCGVEPVYICISRNYKEAEEFATNTELLLSYDSFLDSNDYKLFITNSPMVYCKPDPVFQRYNRLMDEMLFSVEYITPDYVDLFRKVYAQQNPETLKWLLTRLRAALNGALQKPTECFYTYRVEQQGERSTVRWQVAHTVNSYETFCEWIQLAFNTTWEEMNKV